MATLTISDAARRCGVARRTLQQAIRAGQLPLTPDHRVTLDALQQAGYGTATPSRGHAAATRTSVTGPAPGCDAGSVTGSVTGPVTGTHPAY